MCPWTYQTSLNLTSLVFKMRMMVMVMPSLYGSTWLITGSNVFNKWPLSAYPVQVPPSPWSHKGTLSSGSWPLPPHLNVGIRRLDGVSCPLDTPSFVMKSKDEMFPRTFPCIRRGGAWKETTTSYCGPPSLSLSAQPLALDGEPQPISCCCPQGPALSRA